MAHSHAHHDDWERLALDSLDEAGRRSGGARRVVVEQLARESCCVTAHELSESLRSGGSRVGIASVYRALDALQGLGLIQKVEIGEGSARYEAVVPGGDHHHHVVCDVCGQLTPFEDDGLEGAIEKLAKRLRHEVSGHDVLIHGRCANCAKRTA